MSAYRGNYTAVPPRAQTTVTPHEAEVPQEDDVLLPERNDAMSEEINVVYEGDSVPEDGDIVPKAYSEDNISMQDLMPSSHKQPNAKNVNVLPAYDQAIGTRNTCIAGLVFSFGVSITCISIAPWAFRGRRAFRVQTGGYTVDRQGERTFFLGSTQQALVKLAVNVAITICTDCLGYIHSTSFRWALSRENRLHFNSNIRLLASTRRCPSSRWSMNFVSAFLLMTCYAASGQLFIQTKVTEAQSFIVNGIALTALGVGILGQALISALSLYNSSTLIPSWSCNPLNTVLVTMHSQALQHRPARCMLSVHDRDAPSIPTKPLLHQKSLQRAYAPVRSVTRTLWALFLAILTWSLVILAISLSRRAPSASRSLPIYGAHVPDLQLNLSAILLTVAFQSGVTLGLHIAELVVNISRDETTWRRATSAHGTRISQGMFGSASAALLSWEAMVLFALKAVAHWLFGISVGVKEGQVVMNWQGLLPLAALMGALAAFASFLTRRVPQGSQPAAFGHLQTLADLVDVWPERAGQALFWGDKREAGIKGVRHAGVGVAVLKPVRLDQMYAGGPRAGVI